MSARTPLPPAAPEADLAEFEAQRRRLLRLAHRMLGSFGEAEDVVQDTWLRWRRVQREIDEPSGYLTRIVTRLCLDRLKSARARRERYVGPWLPEPQVIPLDAGEAAADEVTVTLLLALERLSPRELFTRVQARNAPQPRLLRTALVDGLPGYVSLDPEGRLQTTALELRDGRIAALYIVRNPDKLRHLAE